MLCVYTMNSYYLLHQYHDTYILLHLSIVQTNLTILWEVWRAQPSTNVSQGTSRGSGNKRLRAKRQL